MEENINGLEEIQTKRLYFDYDEPLTDIRTALLRKLFYGLLIFLVISITSGFFIVFPKTIKTKITVNSLKVDAIYTFDHKVYILEKYVLASGKVQKGDLLIKISSQKIVDLIQDYNHLISEAKLLKNSHDFLLPVEDTIIQMGLIKMRNQINYLKNVQNSIKTQWHEQSKELNNIQSMSYRNYERNLALFNQKVISKAELENHSKQLSESQNIYAKEKHSFEQTLLSLESQIRNNYSLIKENEQKLNISAIEDSLSIKKNNLYLENLKIKLTDLFGPHKIEEGSLILLSPVNGTINSIFDGEKELPIGEALVRIKDSDNSFYATGFATSVNINKLIPNNVVYLKIEAFPFAEYGPIKGRIRNIHKAPDQKGNYSFKIEISESDAQRLSLVQGMEGNAIIHLEKKNFWRHIFEKVKNTTNQ